MNQIELENRNAMTRIFLFFDFTKLKSRNIVYYRINSAWNLIYTLYSPGQ